MGCPIVRAGEIENHARPKFIVQVERFRVFPETRSPALRTAANVSLSECQFPDFAQFLTATPKGLDHSLDVHMDRVEPNVKPKPKQLGRRAARPALPNGLVLLHQHEDAADHLLQHRGQV